MDIFLDVAELQSFAAVARKHDADPSSISRSIATLEAQLGLRLFQRTTRRLSLTEAGEKYLNRIQPVVEELYLAREEALAASAAPTGTLRLTTSVSFGQLRLVPRLPLFRKTYPAIEIDLLMTDENVDLVAARIDLAIRLGPAVTGDVIATKLTDTRYRVCASPEYLQSHPALQNPSDLQEHECLLLALPEFQRGWHFREKSGQITEVPVDGRIVISNPLGLREAALNGLGPTLLSDWVIQEDVAAGRLITLFPDYDVTATTFETAAWLLYPSRAYLPNKVRVAIDFLKNQFTPN